MSGQVKLPTAEDLRDLAYKDNEIYKNMMGLRQEITENTEKQNASVQVTAMTYQAVMNEHQMKYHELERVLQDIETPGRELTQQLQQEGVDPNTSPEIQMLIEQREIVMADLESLRVKGQNLMLRAQAVEEAQRTLNEVNQAVIDTTHTAGVGLHKVYYILLRLAEVVDNHYKA